MVIIYSDWGPHAYHSWADLLLSFLLGMVRARGLKDGSPEFEGERSSGASSSSPLLGLKGPSEEDPRVSPDLSTKGDLVGLAPLIAEVIAQRKAGRTKAHKGAAQRRSSISKSEEVVAIGSGFDLAFYMSKVTQRQLGTLHTQFNIPHTIMMRVLAGGELPPSARKGEVTFLVIALDCGVRLPLASFMR